MSRSRPQFPALDRLLTLELPGTMVFDYPTVASLTAFISSQLVTDAPSAEAAAAAAAIVSTGYMTGRDVQDISHSHGQVVVIDTFSGRFADSSDGGARSLDTCRVTPFQRWDVDGAAPHVSQRPGARFGRYGPRMESAR